MEVTPPACFVSRAQGSFGSLCFMRTYVYADGFNLYYGALKGTGFKWLDLSALMSNLLPRNDIIRVKLFTARITPRPNDLDASKRQNAYLRALGAHCSNLDIIYGHFLSNATRMYLANPPVTGPRTVKVVKTEEKGSDVNLAVHMVDDAWRDLYDVGVVISNDSDLAGPMKIVQRLKKTTGLITPGKRRPSQQLLRYSSFRKTLRPAHLTAAQLPDQIPGTPISKPRAW